MNNCCVFCAGVMKYSVFYGARRRGVCGNHVCVVDGIKGLAAPVEGDMILKWVSVFNVKTTLFPCWSESTFVISVG